MKKCPENIIDERVKEITKSLLINDPLKKKHIPILSQVNHEGVEVAKFLRIGDITFSECFTSCPCCKPCSLCGKNKQQAGRQSLFRCQRCKNSFYCSIECQRNDWKEHKKKCKDVEKNNVLKFHLLYNLGNCNYKHFKPRKCIKYYDEAIRLFNGKLRQEIVEQQSIGLVQMYIFMAKSYLHKGKCLLFNSLQNVLMSKEEEEEYEEEPIDRKLLNEARDALSASVGLHLESPLRESNLEYIIEGLFDLARICYFDGDLKGASSTLNKALDHIKRFDVINNNKRRSNTLKIHIYSLYCSICIQETDRWEKGIEYAQTGLRLLEENEKIKDDLTNNNNNSELQLLKPYFYYFLGYIYFQKNESLESCDAFRKGLSLVEKKRSTLLFGTFDGHLALILNLCLAVVEYTQSNFQSMISYFRKVEEYTGGGGGSVKKKKRKKGVISTSSTYSPVKSFEILKFVRSLMSLLKGTINDKRRSELMKPLKYANHRLVRPSLWF